MLPIHSALMAKICRQDISVGKSRIPSRKYIYGKIFTSGIRTQSFSVNRLVIAFDELL